MEHGISHASLRKVAELYSRAKGQIAHIREKSEETVGRAVEVVEVIGASFGAGYANQKWGTNGEIQVLGIPADLGLGAIGIIAGFTGMLGKYSEHGIHLGSGLGAAYGYRLGAALAAASTAGTTVNPMNPQVTQGRRWPGVGHRAWHQTSGVPAARAEQSEMG